MLGGRDWTCQPHSPPPGFDWHVGYLTIGYYRCKFASSPDVHNRWERPTARSGRLLNVHLVNPSDSSFGTSVITPRWLYVLAAATPSQYGDPLIVDETLKQLDPESIHRGDVVGIGIHTGNALRGYAVGRLARERGATVVYGGIHATLFPAEARDDGGAHAV